MAWSTFILTPLSPNLLIIFMFILHSTNNTSKDTIGKSFYSAYLAMTNGADFIKYVNNQWHDRARRLNISYVDLLNTFGHNIDSIMPRQNRLALM